MMLTKTEGNVFTNAERRLLLLFHLGGLSETADTLRQALPDITDPDERNAAEGLIAKLSGMNELTLADAVLESGEAYV